MRLEQRTWTTGFGWSQADGLGESADLLLVFGAPVHIANQERFEELKALCPKAHIVGCSTAGEIAGSKVLDETLVATAVHFEHSRVTSSVVRAEGCSDFDVGRRLAESLASNDLRHVLVLSEGLNVNGTKLTAGLRSHLPDGVAVTGGLSGDGGRFDRTIVRHANVAGTDLVSAIGLEGDRLGVGFGSYGGWDPFGPNRRVTKAEDNVLYELDNQSALELYERYLGDMARGLPASGLRFPLLIREPDRDRRYVRTILGVDRELGSLTFAGDVPVGSMAQLMKANIDRLVDGAHQAARIACEGFDGAKPELALLISCVGRKLVMNQRVEEEVESVIEVVGQDAAVSGFYSYGEICPAEAGEAADLHNQTMTITVLRED